MRVDEGTKGWSLVAIKTKARTVVGRGTRRASAYDPGSELRVGREIDKGKLRR